MSHEMKNTFVMAARFHYLLLQNNTCMSKCTCATMSPINLVWNTLKSKQSWVFWPPVSGCNNAPSWDEWCSLSPFWLLMCLLDVSLCQCWCIKFLLFDFYDFLSDRHLLKSANRSWFFCLVPLKTYFGNGSFKHSCKIQIPHWIVFQKLISIPLVSWWGNSFEFSGWDFLVKLLHLPHTRGLPTQVLSLTWLIRPLVRTVCGCRHCA